MFLEGETKYKTQKIRFLLILVSISYSTGIQKFSNLLSQKSHPDRNFQPFAPIFSQKLHNQKILKLSKNGAVKNFSSMRKIKSADE